jgi:hypothetical protein
VIAFAACHKEIPIADAIKAYEQNARFFSVINTGNLSPKLHAIIAEIKAQDSIHHFVPTLIQKIGYPVWEKAATSEAKATLVLGSGSNTTVYLIPFKDEKNGQISAYLSCTITADSISYSLHTRAKIIDRINRAEADKQSEMAGFALAIAYFERQVNHRDTLLLQGCILPKFTNASISFGTNATKPSTLGTFEPVTICGDVWVPFNGQVVGVPPGGTINYGQWQWQCRSSTIYVQEVPMDDNSGSMYNNCLAPDGTYNWWCMQSNGGTSFLDTRTVNGVTYTENAYPGMYDGYSWAWWENEQTIQDFWQDDYQGGYSSYYYEYNKLTQAEKQLTTRFPRQALEIRKNKNIAFELTNYLFPTAYGRNDKADGFRHCLWNTLNTISVGRNIAESFGTAHESETPSQLALEKEMDLWNNSIGYDFGEIFNTSLNGLSNDDRFIADYIISNGVLAGLLKYLFPVNYADPNFQTTGGIYNDTRIKFTNQ